MTVPTLHRPTLLSMLTYARTSGSLLERKFIDRFILPLGAEPDTHKNLHVVIGDSPILWSCHTDTVHHRGEFQTLHYDGHVAKLSKRSRRRASCLGADDTTGVFLCHQMIQAEIPGHYIFHFGEEVGGTGSSALAQDPDWYTGLQFAIALDRRGTSDIVTSQFGNCASPEFAASLAVQLNQHGLAYAPCHGVFTDTANYDGIIPECTNLSVGYSHAHSDREEQDLDFLDRLFPMLCQLDPTALIVARDPNDAAAWRIEWDDHVVIDRAPSGLIDVPCYFLYCHYCGIDYDPAHSWARDPERFCTCECELADTRLDAVYLDSVRADVERALRLRCH